MSICSIENDFELFIVCSSVCCLQGAGALVDTGEKAADLTVSGAKAVGSGLETVGGAIGDLFGRKKRDVSL